MSSKLQVSYVREQESCQSVYDLPDNSSVGTLKLLPRADNDGAADVSAAHLLNVRGGRDVRDGLGFVHDTDDLVT